MTVQLSFLDAAPVHVLGVTCAHGETGIGWTGRHHCQQCNAAVEAACRWFDAAKARGEYDEPGLRASRTSGAAAQEEGRI